GRGYVRAGNRLIGHRPNATRSNTGGCALLVACAAALIGLIVSSGTLLAQEGREMTAGTSDDGIGPDQASLAALGLKIDTIERCEDPELLWRAVRELVLRQRISEPVQQRILRR